MIGQFDWQSNMLVGGGGSSRASKVEYHFFDTFTKG